jgi:hypothetical protein
VVSVTFQDEKVTSRATDEFGWRYTPYAYILLKPRGPQVDKIPPLCIDLDFLETSGYVVMPVETPAVPISARSATGDPRPVEKLSVTQTLDERQAEKGILLLEVKAVGVGPRTGVAGAVRRLRARGVRGGEDREPGARGEEVRGGRGPQRDRVRAGVALTLKGREDRPELPTTFKFAPVKVPAKEVVYQRYAGRRPGPGV